MLAIALSIVASLLLAAAGPEEPTFEIDGVQLAPSVADDGYPQLSR